MRDSKNSLLHSISLLAVILSVTAIVLQQQATPALPAMDKQTVVGADTTALEEGFSLLRDDVLRLQARLEAIETSTSQKPKPATEILDEANIDSVSSKSVSALLGQDLSTDERMLAAVEAVMEERGVEYTRAALRRSEIEQSLDKTTEFVDGSLERVPRIIDQVAREMNLGAARQLQLQDVLLTYSDTAAQLTDELYSDPSPGYDETEQIIAEYWQVFGRLGGQLQEVLNEEELKQFGQIVGVVRQQQSEEQQQED